MDITALPLANDMPISSISSLTTNFSFAQQGMEGVIPSRGRGVAFFYITLNPPPRQSAMKTTKGWTGWAGTPGMSSSMGLGQLKLVIDTNLYLAFLFNKEWNQLIRQNKYIIVLVLVLVFDKHGSLTRFLMDFLFTFELLPMKTNAFKKSKLPVSLLVCARHSD